MHQEVRTEIEFLEGSIFPQGLSECDASFALDAILAYGFAICCGHTLRNRSRVNVLFARKLSLSAFAPSLPMALSPSKNTVSHGHKSSRLSHLFVPSPPAMAVIPSSPIPVCPISIKERKSTTVQVEQRSAGLERLSDGLGALVSDWVFP